MAQNQFICIANKRYIIKWNCDVSCIFSILVEHLIKSALYNVHGTFSTLKEEKVLQKQKRLFLLENKLIVIEFTNLNGRFLNKVAAEQQRVVGSEAGPDLGEDKVGTCTGVSTNQGPPQAII